VLQEFRGELLALFQSPKSSEQREVPAFQGQRNLHVSARLDLCLRVKDVLRLLDGCGLLKPTPAGVLPEGSLVGVEVFSEPSEDVDDGASADEHGSGGSQAEKDITEGFLNGATKSGLVGIGGLGGPGGFGGFGGLGGGMLSPEEEEQAAEQAKGAKRKGKGSKEGARHPDEIDRDEVQQCDFSLTMLQALRLMAEVVAPNTLPDVHWELRPPLPSDFAPLADGDGSSATGDAVSAATSDENVQMQPQVAPLDEQVSVFDYVESEVVFTEFLRVVVQMAELGTKRNLTLTERLPLARRLDLFLWHVFLPLLRTRYTPPPEEDEEDPNNRRLGSATSSAEGGAEDPLGDPLGAAVPETAGAEAAEGVEGAEEGEKKEAAPAPPELWPGFEGPSEPPREPAAIVAAATFASGLRGLGRHWPEGYDAEVDDW